MPFVQPREHANDSLSGFLLNEGESVRVDGTHSTRDSVDLQSADVLRRIGELAKIDSYQPIPMHNTGVRLQEGEEDPFWKIVAADPESGVSTPRYAVVCEPHHRYATNEPSRSQWISTGRSNELLPADSAYTFQTQLNLSRYEVGSVRLIGQILADNGVKEVRVNDRPIKGISWIDNVFLQNFHRKEFHVLEISAGFKPGVNLVEIDVWNGGEYRNNALSLKAVPNPMALRVEWQAFGRPLLVN